MAVRNFWIEADIDGRKTELHGGPRRIRGGFTERIYYRHRGNIEGPVRIEGKRPGLDGDLVLTVFPTVGDGVTLTVHTGGGFTIHSKR